MEGWQKNKTKEVTTIVQERVVETATMSQEDGQLIDGLDETEATARRLDSKRKGEENKSRRAKKRKFPRLEGWGDLEDDTNYGESLADWLEEPEVVRSVVEVRVKEPTAVDMIEMETLSMLQRSSKLTEKKLKISDGVRKSKFVFNTRGKLTKKEVVELKRTHNNIFDWVAKEKCKVIEKDNFEQKMKDVDMATIEETALEREERLQRVIVKQKEFQVKKVCMDVLEEMLGRVRQYRTMEMITTMLEGMADQAVEMSMINRMAREAEEYGPNVRNKLELRLTEQRMDEDRAARSMLEEECKEARLEWMEMKRQAWKVKYKQSMDTRLVRSMAELRLEEAIMEMSWLASDEVSPKKLKTRGDQEVRNIKLMIQNHEIGCDVDSIARLVPNGVSPEKLKTSEDLSIKIGYDVKIDNHEGGVDVDIDFEARLVTDEVGPEKLKTSENLSNKFGFEIDNMDTGLAFNQV
jgi:hypothetical protein